jgi:hypothetical protein
VQRSYHRSALKVMLGGGSRNAGAQENRTRCTQREVLARSHEQQSADFFELHRDAFERPRRSCDARRLPNSCRACGEPQDSRSLAGHAREQGDWPGRSHESVTAYIYMCMGLDSTGGRPGKASSSRATKSRHSLSVLALWDCVSRPGQVCPASATGSRSCRAASARSDYPRGPGIEAAGPCEAEAGVRHQREVPLASCPRAPRSSASVPARRRTSRR